jgi:hypothetical protein
MSKAHHHAILYLNVAVDEAGMADMGVLNDYTPLYAAVSAYGDIPFQYNIP